MDKHVVFMVHGVGEQVPGETVDEFVGAACEELELTGPVTNNTVMLANDKAKKDGLLSLFPCHQRRISGTSENEELLLAEVHWADISPAPFGVVATSLDLLRLILGIGYIALDNVENNVARKNTGVKLLVPWFIWLFYAVIAPLNLFLLIGAFALLADPLVINFKTSPINTFAALTLFGLIFAVFGHLRSKAARTYLDKLIMRGLCACGVVTVAFALMFVAGTDLPYQEIIAPKCNTFADDSALCELTYFTNLGVIVLKLSWLIAVLSLMMLVLVSMPGARSHLWEKRSIYLAVCSAMLILWMTVTVAIWMLAIEMITRLPGSEAMSGVAIIDAGFKDATQTLVYGVL